MEKKGSGQSLKLLPIAGLLMITPLLSTSLRFKYLYFIVNILIIAVGAEAGLISFFLQSQYHHTKKQQHYANSSTLKINIPQLVVEAIDDKCSLSDQVEANTMPSSSSAAISTLKIIIPQPVIDKCRHSISDHEVDADKTPSKQELMEGEELYHKSEIFIGNFYKQLKMQRQHSWNNLHHISHK